MFCNQLSFYENSPWWSEQKSGSIFSRFVPFSSSLRYTVSLNIQRFLRHVTSVFLNYLWSSFPSGVLLSSGGKLLFLLSSHAVHHLILSFLAQTIHPRNFQVKRSLFFFLLLLRSFLPLLFCILNVFHYISLCVTSAMFFRQGILVLSCFLLRLSLPWMTSWVKTLVVIVLLEIVVIFHR